MKSEGRLMSGVARASESECLLRSRDAILGREDQKCLLWPHPLG